MIKWPKPKPSLKGGMSNILIPNKDPADILMEEKKGNLVLPIIRPAEPPVSPVRTWRQRMWSKVNSFFYYPPAKQIPRVFNQIAIIGVHGWFPSKLFSPVVGELLGTSELFTDKMNDAIRLWFHEQGITLSDEQIQCIPLSGQGMAEERVSQLYQGFLSNEIYISGVKKADLVIFVAHSQGCPVATMILDKMMRDGFIDPIRQQTGILAMAGIHHGPHPSLGSSVVIKYMEKDPARQLFDFNDPSTAISRQYYRALRSVLTSGTKVCMVGSWYDQVVPLYSATMNGCSHPNIYRALYIDFKDYRPDFLSHLVVFALKLRNYGFTDYGLIVQLSDILLGNIYGFGTQGHSAIYSDINTYSLGVKWITSNFVLCNAPGSFHLDTPPFRAPSKINPYFLPWIMSKLLNDDSIKGHRELGKEVQDILDLYHDWHPTTAPQKELRYRLEPIKSKL